MSEAVKATAKAQAPATSQGADDTRKRMRSPAYPYVNLEAALNRTKVFYAAEQRNSAPLKIAAKHWNYEEKSSGAAQTAAALISFGLMQDEGTGDKRRLKLTHNALRILLDERAESEERARLVKDAALAPKIHQELWRRWGPNLPSHDSLKHTLMFDWQPPFNPASVDGFIREYKDTIGFAKLSDSDMVPPEAEDNGEQGGKNAGGAAVIAPQVPPGGKRSNMSEEVFSVPEGKVTMHWPTPLGKDSIDDIQAWLDIIKRKISRSMPQESHE